MTKLYVSFDSYCESTREASSDDEWDRGDSHTSKSLSYVSSTNNNWDESFDSTEDVQRGDTVYVVWGHWGSGDTFGHDSGAYAELFEITKDKEKAYRLSDFLKGQSSYGAVEFERFPYYIPWGGYFDSFEDMHVDQTMVK